MNARLILLAAVLAGCTVPLPPARTTQAPPPPKLENEPPPLAESSKPVPPPVYAAPKAPEPPPIQAAPNAAAKAPEPPAKAAAPPKSAAAPKQAAAPAAAPPPSAHPTLDLRSLEQRLRDTSAIGVLTKLSLKNQVDDLIARFRTFHAGQRPPTLADLKPAFELLLMKVLSLLQDHDKALANDINASRDAIWGVLADRDKLSQAVN